MFTLIHKSIHSMIELTSKLVDLEHTLALHRAVYAAIQKRDSEEARRRMAEHLLDVRGLLQRANDEHHRSHYSGASRLCPLPETLLTFCLEN